MRTLHNKKGGVVTSTVVGVGILIIMTIITVVVVTTLTGADLYDQTASTTVTITNESDGDGKMVYLNSTTYVLDNVNTTNTGYVISIVYADDGQTNGTQSGILLGPTGYNLTVPSANYTVNSTGGITNATSIVYPNISVTYTYSLPYTTNTKETETAMTGNFTSGLNKVSAKIPTILLIVAVVFLFGALVLLIRNTEIFGLGGRGGSSL